MIWRSRNWASLFWRQPPPDLPTIRQATCWDASNRAAQIDACQAFLTDFVSSRLPAGIRRHLGASDIVQSVLFVISDREEAFRGGSELEFRAWIRQIARRKIIDGIRRYREKSATVKPSPHSCLRFESSLAVRETPSDRVSLDEQVQLLVTAITELPDELREIVRMRYLHNATFEEIAESTDTPTTTVRRRWLEGVSHLEARLGPVLQ
jgi:RNA polymerase sigma-70 factor (ECF subfamily)